MHIVLNGEKREVPDELTVGSLLAHLKIQPQRVAVELNETIVRKERYEQAVVRDGDSLEVVSFMGGGGSSAMVVRTGPSRGTFDKKAEKKKARNG